MCIRDRIICVGEWGEWAGRWLGMPLPRPWPGVRAVAIQVYREGCSEKEGRKESKEGRKEGMKVVVIA